MQTIADPHPEREQLSAFALGKLELAAVGAVESHLASCPTCCETLKQIHEDTFVGLVRDSGKDGAPAEPRTITDASPADAVTVPPSPTAEEASESSRTEGMGQSAQVADLPAALANHPRYRVLALLGTGGMGAVYKAEHRLMQRPVALKLINSNLVASKSAIERFRREVQAAARLHHPNIVTAHDAEQAGDVHFLAMEYVPGTDLSKLLEERGPPPVAEACEYIRQAALGLQHAHERGMVHRDIKPQNLMLTAISYRLPAIGQKATAIAHPGAANSQPTADRRPPTAVVKILDFGLASLATEAIAEDTTENQQSAIDNQKSGLTQAGTIMGTPDYMAPEQARDAHSADIRADIYSLGCTLYCLLTGQVPFPGGTTVAKVMAHAESKPRPVNETRKDVPAALVKVLDKMMAKKPAERYQTPAEVAEALAPLTAARGQRRRRRPLLAAALAALGAGILAVAAVVFYIVTDNCAIEIRTDDENVKIVAERNGKVITILDPKSKQTWIVDTGEWTVRLDGNPEGLHIDLPHSFTLKRGGKQVVTVKRVVAPVPLAVTAPAKELAKWEGSWEAEGDAKMTIKGDRWTSITPGFDPISGKLKIVEIRDKLTLVDLLVEEGWSKGKTCRMILRLEGDALHYCGTYNATRPTEFKAVGANIYYAWKRSRVSEIRSLHAHANGVTSMAFLPDSERAITAGNDNFIRLWDLNTGKEIRRFEGHTAPVRRIALSPDGHRLVSGGSDATVRVWDVDAGKEILRFTGHKQLVIAVALSPDGRYVLSASADKTVRLWDVATHEEFSRYDSTPYGGVFTPDSRHFLHATADHIIRLREVKSGKEIRRFEGHTSWPMFLAFSTDGRRMLSTSWDHTVRLWDVESGKELKRWERTERVEEAHFSRDGRRALTAGLDGTFRLLDVETGKELQRWDDNFAYCAAISPKGDLGLLAGEKDGFVRLWRLPQPEPEGLEIEGPWVQLFNGKDLGGWKTHPDKPGKWEVKDGVLIGSGPPSHLFSERGDFENFHLRIEAKINRAGNSGILFHSKYGYGFDLKAFKGEGKTPFGYEMEFVSPSWPTPSGTVFRMDAEPSVMAAKTPPIADDTWCKFEIIARGNHIVTKVDGKTATDFTDVGKVFHKGHLALQVEHPETIVQFKNIEIKELGSAASGLKKFGPSDKTISQDLVVDQGAWRIDAKEPRTVRLFEVPTPGVQECILTYRAKIKTKDLVGKAYLEMWSRITDQGEGFAQGRHNALSGTNDWASYEIPFFLYMGQRSEQLKLNLAIEGKGTVWIKDIEVLRSAPKLTTPWPGGPFLIVAVDGRPEKPRLTLAEAMAAAKPGDIIEILGNGPFPCEPITVEKHGVVIRAAAGFAPVLALSAAHKDSDEPLINVKAPLVLEGVELQRFDASPWKEEQPSYLPLIRVADTSFAAANCRFTMRRQNGTRGLQAIQVARSPNATVRLRNCAMLDGDMFLAVDSPKANVSLENCLINGAGYVAGSNLFSALDDVRIDIRRSTLAGGQSFFFVVFPEVELLKVKPSSYRIDWTDNVVLSMPLLAMQGVRKDAKPLSPLELEQQFSQAVKIVGDRNLYSLREPFSHIYLLPGDKAQVRKLLADWEELWGRKEVGSLQSQAKFKNYEAVLKQGGVALDDFRLVAGTPGKAAGKDGKDLGADLDLVGPGAAYERWKTTPSYKQWRRAHGFEDRQEAAPNIPQPEANRRR